MIQVGQGGSALGLGLEILAEREFLYSRFLSLKVAESHSTTKREGRARRQRQHTVCRSETTQMSFTSFEYLDPAMPEAFVDFSFFSPIT